MTNFFQKRFSWTAAARWETTVLADRQPTELAIKQAKAAVRQAKGQLQMIGKSGRVKMAFDFKKEYKEFYLPRAQPEIVTLPKMNYLAVRGSGNPNDANGAYQASIGLLYGIAYTIKMSKKGEHPIEGYFDYVVPPLEGFWWQEGTAGFDPKRKDQLHFISVIRLPDFVSKADFDWALAETSQKKKQDFSAVEFLSIEEGLCVQIMHIGSFDDEPTSIERMHQYTTEQGYTADFSGKRLHHEIYLSDFRRTAPEKLKTVIRHPIKNA